MGEHETSRGEKLAVIRKVRDETVNKQTHRLSSINTHIFGEKFLSFSNNERFNVLSFVRIMNLC